MYCTRKKRALCLVVKIVWHVFGRNKELAHRAAFYEGGETIFWFLRVCAYSGARLLPFPYPPAPPRATSSCVCTVFDRYFLSSDTSVPTVFMREVYTHEGA